MRVIKKEYLKVLYNYLITQSNGDNRSDREMGYSLVKYPKLLGNKIYHKNYICQPPCNFEPINPSYLYQINVKNNTLILS